MRPVVLFILHLPPPVHGASMMGKYIHDSRIINDTFDCYYINLTTAKDLADIGKVGFGKVKSFARLLHTIKTEVKRFGPDLVYVTPNACGGAFYKDFIVVQMLKRMGCRIVVHYHNKGVATRQERMLDNCLYKLFFKELKVVLLAEALYNDVKKYVSRDNVYICPNGIPETLSLGTKTERENDVPHILFLSNLIVSKGVLVLLDALKELRQRGREFQCCLVGGETLELDGDGLNTYLTGSGLNDCVKYEGRKYGDEKAEYFENADIFVFPTFYHNECFPLVCLEAMEWKLPVVSTDEGGIPDVVKDGENGFIIQCQRNGNINYGPSSTDLADALERLIENPELCHCMGENGYNKFKKEFTLQAFERNFVKSLQWAINQ